jgi:hypothetical protein
MSILTIPCDKKCHCLVDNLRILYVLALACQTSQTDLFLVTYEAPRLKNVAVGNFQKPLENGSPTKSGDSLRNRAEFAACSLKELPRFTEFGYAIRT